MPAAPWGWPYPADDFRRVEDLTYLYLDLLDALAHRAVLLGASFGGWVAMEIAATIFGSLQRARIDRTVGASPGGKNATLPTSLPHQSTKSEILFDGGAPDYSSFSDDEMTDAGRGKQYLFSTAGNRISTIHHSPAGCIQSRSRHTSFGAKPTVS